MKLLYVYIEKFGNVFKNQFFNFSDEYIVNYNVEKQEISIEKNKSYLENFYGKVISDITAIVGENGVGKTTLLDLIGRTYKDRLELSNISNNEILDKYFIIYHVVDNIFYFEGSGNISISNCKEDSNVQEKSNSRFNSFYFKKVDIDYKIFEYINDVNEKIVYLNDNYIRSTEDLVIYSESVNTTKFLPRVLGDIFSLKEWYLVYIDLVDSGMVKSKDATILFKRDNEVQYEDKFIISPINEDTSEYLDTNLLYIEEYLSDFFSHSISCVVSYIIKKSIEISNGDIYNEWHKLNNIYRNKVNFKFDEYKELFNRCIDIISNNKSYEYYDERNVLVKYVESISDLFYKLYNVKEYIIPGIDEFKLRLESGFKNNAVIDFIEAFINIQKIVSSLKINKKEDWIYEYDEFEDYSKLNLQLAMPFDIFRINMSTGEKKLISLLSQITYEVKKYISMQPIRVANQEKNYIILVDEIESTMHLEWSRSLLNFIIKYIENQYLDYDREKKQFYRDLGLRVQLIFTTHSPFLLSDLRKNSVIALEVNDGFISKKKIYVHLHRTFKK